ncbi:MAG TPA: zf-HC2 domain-containing protein [Gemmatimonadales bacterium]|nr:zf-HC2 domain-containing protein [Gemmatimonadales bacterium]
MNCDTCRELLDGYVAGRLLPADRDAIAQHARTCAACLADLDAAEALVAPLASLGRGVEPPTDLWPGVARRIQPAPWRRRAAAVAAVLLLMAGSSALTAILLQRGTTPAPVENGQSVAQLIEAQYAPRAEALSTLLERERASLDPATVATIERNLAVIDRAIAESREALARDPSDPDLRALFRTSQAQRVALLEQATRIAREL